MPIRAPCAASARALPPRCCCEPPPRRCRCYMMLRAAAACCEPQRDKRGAARQQRAAARRYALRAYATPRHAAHIPQHDALCAVHHMRTRAQRRAPMSRLSAMFVMPYAPLCARAMRARRAQQQRALRAQHDAHATARHALRQRAAAARQKGIWRHVYSVYAARARQPATLLRRCCPRHAPYSTLHYYACCHASRCAQRDICHRCERCYYYNIHAMACVTRICYAYIKILRKAEGARRYTIYAAARLLPPRAHGGARARAPRHATYALCATRTLMPRAPCLFIPYMRHGAHIRHSAYTR